jgi:predicted ATP-grasp superfamily ATP-dependent carboligase
MSRVLVTDGEQRAALALIRSLGSAGHQVYVCSPRPRSLAGASRYCSGHVAVPDALRHPAEFVAAVAELIESWGVEVLIPTTEPALLALLPERHCFPDTRIPFAPYERFVEICDKARVAEAAEKVGIRVPAQVTLLTPEDAPRLRDRIRFPLVLKSSRSVVELNGGRIKSGVMHVDGWEAFLAALKGFPASAYPLLLQERIVGPGVGAFLLISGGELVAAFAHRRIREKPPSGGVSVYRESIPLDPELLEHSLALLKQFDWEGVAMVEYKLEEETGTPYIMEINGRFWGSLQLAIDAGVDFPRLLVEGGRPGGPVLDYRPGVRSRWEWGDVDHLIARLFKSERTLALPPGYPGRGRAVLDFLAAFGQDNRCEILRLRDPLPFLRESYDWLRRR